MLLNVRSCCVGVCPTEAHQVRMLLLHLSKRNPIAQSVANDSRQGLECQALRVGTSVDLQQSKVGQSGIQLTANETHVVLQERDA